MFLLVGAASAFGQSGWIQNAATITAPPSGFDLATSFVVFAAPPTSRLAQGSLAIINYSQATSLHSGALNAVVSLRPVGSASTISVQVIKADTNTITFVVPPLAPLGPAQLIYRAEGDTTKWVAIEVVSASFALFGDDRGRLQAQMVSKDGSFTLNQLTNPASVGQVVSLSGSGLGLPPVNVSVLLGGVAQTVLSAGASPNLPGVDEINFRVSDGTPDGCYVPLTIRYGKQMVSSTLSTSTISSATASVSCRHPFGLASADLQKLDSGGSLSVVRIAITSGLQVSATEHATRQDSAVVSQNSWSASQVAAWFSPRDAQGCKLGGSQVNGLLVLASPNGIGMVGDPSFGPQTLSNGTSTVTLSDENHYASTSNSPDAPLSSVPSTLFTAGQWTWKAPDSFNLPTSQFTFSIPPTVRLNGVAPLVLHGDRDQAITWSGAGFDPNAIATLTISGQRSHPFLTCLGMVGSSVITVPKELIAQLDSGIATISISVAEQATTNPFTLLQRKFSGATLILVTPVSSDTRTADIQ
jgi:uncharacterized protein (TIGR03437 family)